MRSYSDTKQARRQVFGLVVSNDHLCDTLASQSLATNKLLTLQARESIEKSRNDEEYRRSNQARGTSAKTSPLNSTKDGIHGGTHPIRGKAADESIKCGGCRADSEEEGYFDEEDDEGRSPVDVRMGNSPLSMSCNSQADNREDNSPNVEAKDVRDTKR